MFVRESCSSGSKNKSASNRLFKEHYSNFQCDHCTKSYPLRGNLQRHKKTVHDGVEDFQCDKCSILYAHKPFT